MIPSNLFSYTNSQHGAAKLSSESPVCCVLTNFTAICHAQLNFAQHWLWEGADPGSRTQGWGTERQENRTGEGGGCYTKLRGPQVHSELCSQTFFLANYVENGKDNKASGGLSSPVSNFSQYCDRLMHCVRIAPPNRRLPESPGSEESK